MLTQQQVVYIDVLFIVNLILNYFILLAVSMVLHRQDKRFRLFGAACLGALYSLFIFYPTLSFLYTSLAKLLFSVSIVLAAYSFRGLKSLLRLILCFYIINIVFGGIIFAIWFFFAPPGMSLRNGVVYFDISPLALILCGGGCYIIVLLLSRFLHRNTQAHSLYRLTIRMGGLEATTPALLDTGNGLCDILTGAPVLVVEYSRIQKLIPRALRPSFQKGTLETAGLSSSPWAGKIRMIPYASVGSKGGLLPAFRPDGVVAEADGREINTKNVLVAVSPGRLSDDGSFGALLSPHLLSEVRAD